MRKLDKDDIIFIDTYLKNSDIFFTDIRVEMVDHVASEIEQRMANDDTRGFYYIFKDYMVENKLSLLESNKKFIKATDISIGKKWLKQTLSLKSFIVFLIVLLGFYGIQFLNFEIMIIKIIPLFMLVCIGVIYTVFIKKRKERFSGIERLGFFFLFLYYLVDFSWCAFLEKPGALEEPNLVALMILPVSILTISMTLLLTAFQLKKEYRVKFTNLVS